MLELGATPARSYPAELLIGARVCERVRDHGVILRPLGDVVVLMPPLCITEAELATLQKSLENTQGARGSLTKLYWSECHQNFMGLALGLLSQVNPRSSALARRDFLSILRAAPPFGREVRMSQDHDGLFRHPTARRARARSGGDRRTVARPVPGLAPRKPPCRRR